MVNQSTRRWSTLALSGKDMAFITNIDAIEIDVRALDLMPESVARENSVLAISVSDYGIRVIVPAGERNDETIEMLKFILNIPILADTSDRRSIDAAINFHYPAKYAEIDNCKPQFRFKCQNRWYDLRQTEDKNVRYCNECDQNVFLCHTQDEMISRARKSQCVALAKELEELEFMGLIDFEGNQS
jgi:hypothetical protein